jgi:hypothetical protein
MLEEALIQNALAYAARHQLQLAERLGDGLAGADRVVAVAEEVGEVGAAGGLLFGVVGSVDGPLPDLDQAGGVAGPEADQLHGGPGYNDYRYYSERDRRRNRHWRRPGETAKHAKEFPA